MRHVHLDSPLTSSPTSARGRDPSSRPLRKASPAPKPVSGLVLGDGDQRLEPTLRLCGNESALNGVALGCADLGARNVCRRNLGHRALADQSEPAGPRELPHIKPPCSVKSISVSGAFYRKTIRRKWN